MGFGVGFRVSPGVRLRATRGGPRVSLGPRIARVHLGGGAPAVSAGRGPVTVWHSLSGGGHGRGAPGAASAAKSEAWEAARHHLDTLLQQHRQPVTLAGPPVLAPPEPVQRTQVRRELRAAATAGIAWWQFGRRRAARRDADTELDAEVARRTQLAARTHAEEQARADRWWQALNANDPDIVTARLEHAFAEQDLPATPTAVEGATVHLVLSMAGPDELIGEREPTWTDAGNLSLARMTKTRQQELYQAALSSTVVATAAEALAVCPGLSVVDVAVVSIDPAGAPAVLQLAELPRETVLPAGADRPGDHSLSQLAEAGHATVVQHRAGRTRELRPLDAGDEAVRHLLDVLDTE